MEDHEWPEIVLNGGRWLSADDAYSSFFEAVGAPKWHGRNLAALNDSIGTGRINEVEVPYRVRITGLSSMSPAAKEFVESFVGLLTELRDQGVKVKVRCEG